MHKKNQSEQTNTCPAMATKLQLHQPLAAISGHCVSTNAIIVAILTGHGPALACAPDATFSKHTHTQ